MPRVDELQKKYPNVSREYIIKWDVLSQGIRDTEALDKISEWTHPTAYQSRDHDVTLKQIAAKRPETVKPGAVMRPKNFYMKHGTGASIHRSSKSPYEICAVGQGEFALCEGEEKIEDIYFPGPKRWGDELVTSNGTPVTTLIGVQGRCFRMTPTRFCEYFKYGDECKFCNYNSTYDDARVVGSNSAVTVNLEDTVEAYKIISSEVRLVEGIYYGGAVVSDSQEAGLMIRLGDKLLSAAPYTPNVRLSVPPFGKKDLQRLKDTGVACISSNIEVWEPEIFAAVCPGKSKYRGYQRYLEFYQEAVEVFGAGNVGCTFVAGVSLMPPNGHKTWQESRDSLIEACRWLIKNHVFPQLVPLRLGVGSPYGDDKSNRAKFVPAEYHLDVSIAHHQLMLDYGFYDKMNKLAYCPLDCPPSAYNGELGMIALAGDVGQWAAQVFPEEANWLAKFISSMQRPATTA